MREPWRRRFDAVEFCFFSFCFGALVREEGEEEEEKEEE